MSTFLLTVSMFMAEIHSSICVHNGVCAWEQDLGGQFQNVRYHFKKKISSKIWLSSSSSLPSLSVAMLSKLFSEESTKSFSASSISLLLRWKGDNSLCWIVWLAVENNGCDEGKNWMPGLCLSLGAELSWRELMISKTLSVFSLYNNRIKWTQNITEVNFCCPNVLLSY